MILVLNFKPQLEQQLQQIADGRGLSVADLLIRNLEDRWLNNSLAGFFKYWFGRK
jgi:hypothetical protein